MKRKISPKRKLENVKEEYVDNVTVENEPLVSGLKIELTDGVFIDIDIGNCQNQGDRNYQEDSFGYSNITDNDLISQKGMLAILSDGMGGLANGRDVSQSVVQMSNILFESMSPSLDIKSQMESIIKQINVQVCMKYVENGVSKAGATALLLYIYKNYAYWTSVGDSRIYCIRNTNIFQLNEDHDYKNTLYREYISGDGTIEAAETDSQKDNLVSFIGKTDLDLIDTSINGLKIYPGDIFILCSDGIYNGITLADMIRIAKNNNAQQASEQIVKAVIDNRIPGQDNMTVMIIKCLKK